MNIEEIKQQIRDNVKIVVVKPIKNGGQTAGLMHHDIKLVSEELSLEITFSYHRSMYKNKEFLKTIFELTLDELVK